MPPRRRWKTIVAVLVAGALVSTVAAWVLAPRGTTAPSTPASRDSVAFLETYVDGDGRVIRRDQGGDTVSEGQAYAMLVAVSIDDRHHFDLAWQWAIDHLARPDGLWSWRWASGAVTDPMPAADADLDAAWALTIAAQRFGDDRYRQAATRMAGAIMDAEVVDTAGTRELAAGPWAVSSGTINPGYAAPQAMEALAALTNDGRWHDLAASSRRFAATLATSRLPSDWAQIDPTTGDAHPAAPPQQMAEAHYGLDAARLVVWLATDCNDASRALASSWARKLTDRPAASARALDGSPASYDEHPATGVASAIAFAAGGDDDASTRAVDDARSLDAAQPSYYGSAWLALGGELLRDGSPLSCSQAK